MSFSSVFPPRRGRSHEATGPGAPAFAAILCGMGKAALWLVEDWRGEALNPQGLAPFCDPDRLIVVHASGQTEMLAAMEEALRSGAVDTVVAELSRPLGLTEGRRLQLAAEAGRSLGLCLIAEGAGSNAAETRWHCAPVFDPAADPEGADSTLQDWTLKKNKSGTLGAWRVRWDGEAGRVIVVSKPGERPGAAP